ncbi:Beta-lactamase precursor [Methyloligella halotolerans]|uniref:Beta-lactamase n=1 Tax=Methyloligella halotolerans TaxID=1177755 RepID=A0A1E2RZT5_9HYPH|nr:Beta-lactamase precursor [Methyloligella halotolerans]
MSSFAARTLSSSRSPALSRIGFAVVILGLLGLALPAAWAPDSAAAESRADVQNAAAKPSQKGDGELLETPVVPMPPLFTQADIDRAKEALPGFVTETMERTGVPGIAVGVVYKDKVIFAEGYGVREVGKDGKIDADTVFQLASVSKPIASTIVAKLVGDGIVSWQDTAKRHNPAFALNDPYVTANATIADLLSHRSGLQTGAGDLLEDLASTAPISFPISTSSRWIPSAPPITTAISAIRREPSRPLRRPR